MNRNAGWVIIKEGRRIAIKRCSSSRDRDDVRDTMLVTAWYNPDDCETIVTFLFRVNFNKTEK